MNRREAKKINLTKVHTVLVFNITSTYLLLRYGRYTTVINLLTNQTGGVIEPVFFVVSYSIMTPR